MFGTAAFGEAMFAEQSYRDMSIPSSTYTPWILQVRTREGVMLHRLDGWFNCQEERKINQPGTLNFSIPLEHPVVKTGNLAGPNEIWTVDVSGLVQHKYIIQEERARLVLGGNTYDIKATGYLKSLAEERGNIPLEGTVSVEQVVDAVIARYRGTPEITKGYLEPSIANAGVDLGDASSQSLLSVLNSVRKSGIGGWFEVDNERALNWRSLNTTFPEQVFQLPDNLIGYEEKTQRSEIFNRIFATGGVVGPGNNRTIIELAAPGYIEDAASIAVYGRRSITISKPMIRTPLQLTAVAQAFLDDHKSPPVQRTLPAIDISHLQDSTAERIESVVRLGTPVTLKPPVQIPGSPVPFNVNIVGFTRRLDDPLEVTIEFDEEEIDLFRRLVQAIQVDGPVNITNIITQDTENLWQAINGVVSDFQDLIDGLDLVTTFTGLDDTPNSYNAGSLYQANAAEADLGELAIGTVGSILQVNTSANAVNYLPLGAKGGILQVNGSENALQYLGLGNARQVVTVNSGATGLEYSYARYGPTAG